MLNNKEVSDKKPQINKIWQYIRKNAFTILMAIGALTMVVSPDAKSFVLRQLMATGLFKATMDKKHSGTGNHVTTDFDFVDEQGNAQNTSTLRGKVVFINFWASWCPPCRAEFPSVEKLYAKLKDDPNVFFLTVNKDNDLSVGRAYLDKEKFTVPVFQSSGSVPAEIYSGALPTTIVLDKNGNIRYHNTGFANYASDKFVKQMEELINEH